MYHSSRFIYRESRPSDIDDLMAMWNDAEIQRNMTAEYPAPKTDAFRETLGQWANSTLLYVVVIDKETGKLVGQTSLRWPGIGATKNRDAELGMMIGREYWGRGVGREVLEWTMSHGFRALGLHRISISVFEGNPKAIALYKKAGFAQEGARSKANWVDGEWEDLILMGMLEEDYFRLEKEKGIVQ
ncbi:acyl-CoA N-acyltransferase [Artomyces pyxidatus]|uniref:Acyl-CoA N-acyltransferase n=1 Tax=Artomyces pyxidatus TaxID=48021 RepID=A0ACB8SG59_9AGAM|nr:acyl-CoA N-acyltransferase [Artomyces pyxidatus]